MTLLIIILAQFTLLLGLAIAVSYLCGNNVARSHGMVLAGFAGGALLPLVSTLILVCDWGLLPATPYESQAEAMAPRNAYELGELESSRHGEIDLGRGGDSSYGQPLNVSPRFGSPQTFDDPIVSSSIPTFEQNRPTPSPAPSQSPDSGSGNTIADQRLSILGNADDKRWDRLSVGSRIGYAEAMRSNTPDTSEIAALSWLSLVTILVAWSLASLLAFLRLAMGFRRARRILRESIPIHEGELASLLSGVQRDLEIVRKVALAHSKEISCPIIWSWGTPAIVLPNSSLDRPVQWSAVLAHELAHLKRRDHVSTLFLELVRCVLPWHPLVVLGCARAERLSELACDAWALNSAESAELYSESLLQFAPLKSPLVVPAMANRRSRLKHRVRMILSGTNLHARLSRQAIIGIQLSAFVVTALVGMLQPSRTGFPDDSTIVGPTVTGIQATPVTSTPAVLSRQATESSSLEDLVVQSEPKPTLAQDDAEVWSESQWIEQLTGLSESSNWYIARNLGARLSGLPEDEGHQILEKCWDDCGVHVRRRLLQGFDWATELNPRYIQVFALGARSQASDVRDYAIKRINKHFVQEFSGDDLSAFEEWIRPRAEWKTVQFLQEGFARLAERHGDPKTRNIFLLTNWVTESQKFLSKTPANYVFLASGIRELMTDWADDGLLSRDHEVFDVFLQVAQSSPSDPNMQQPEIAASDSDWMEYLTTRGLISSGDVGTRAGMTMSTMPGHRPYNLLSQCWDQIHPSVRCYIMRGFSPTFGNKTLHEDFFRILHLGLMSEDAKVREFATEYLKWNCYREFRTQEEYLTWWETVRDLSARDIVEQSSIAFVERLESASEVEIDLQLHAFSNGVNRQLMLLRLTSAGLIPVIDQLIEQARLPFSRGPIHFLKGLPLKQDVLDTWIDQQIPRLVSGWENVVAAEGSTLVAFNRELSATIRHLGYVESKRAIPTLIGLMDADNSREIVTTVGQSLRNITGVPSHPTHDGSWWRRWWEANKATMPEAVRALEIPELPKTSHGQAYIPFPEKLDTVDGTIEWMLEQPLKSNNCRMAMDLLADHFAARKAIPYMIAIMDSDNSPETRSQINARLKTLTGVQPLPVYDGPWWRQWWTENRTSFPDNVSQLDIPVLPKTDFGQTYVSFAERGLDTFDGQVSRLMDATRSDDEFYEITELIARSTLRHIEEKHIPTIIGIIDADNSTKTVPRLAGHALDDITEVEYSPLHDGPWWRRWWENNKVRYSRETQAIEVPDFPKTSFGKEYEPYPPELETLDQKIAFLNTLDPSDYVRFRAIVDSLRTSDVSVTPLDAQIPKLIGIIDADNSHHTIYTVGYFVLELGGLGVEYSPLHDGPWWRRWWERNKHRFSEEAQRTEIPEIKKTAFGESYEAVPAQLDTLEGTIAWVHQGCPSRIRLWDDDVVEALVGHGDPKAIPVMIGWLKASNSPRKLTAVADEVAKLTFGSKGYFLTPEEWETWWADNKHNYPDDVREYPIPDLTDAVRLFRQGQQELDNALQDPVDNSAKAASRRHTAAGNARMQYFQIGPAADEERPADGWKVLLIVPASGSFHESDGLGRRIHAQALPKGYVTIQLVAPVWSDRDDRTPWPTAAHNPDNVDFTTEEFIAAVFHDVATRLEVDRHNVFALGWSESGPAVFANSLFDDSPVTGSIVAVSPFQTGWLPEFENADKHSYCVLHGSKDWQAMDELARKNEQALLDRSRTHVRSRLVDGQPWIQDPYESILLGIEMLESAMKTEFRH